MAKIAELLMDPDSDVRGSAAKVLGLQDELSEDHIAQIAVLLKDPDKNVRQSAVEALRYVGELSKNQIAQIAELLKDPDKNVRQSTSETLSKIDELSKDQIAKIAGLLKDPDEEVRQSAIETFGKINELSKDHIAEIVELFKDPDEDVRRSAVETIGMKGEQLKDYVVNVAELLKDPDEHVRQSAVKALGNMSEFSKNYIVQIAELLKDPEIEVRDSAAETLGKMSELSREYIVHVAELLKDSGLKYQFSIEDALYKMGEPSQDQIVQITNLLKNRNSDVRDILVEFILRSQELSLTNFPHILAPIYLYPSESSQYRFLGHVVGAGKENTEIVLKWLGEPGDNLPNKLSKEEAIKTLQVFRKLWDATASHRKVRKDLADQIARIICKHNVVWTKSDLKLLIEQKNNLEKISSTHIDAIEYEIKKAANISRIQTFVKIGAVHATFWLVLILLYPKYPMIQAIFFWNPFMRKILGLGYINFALTWVPYLRQKLFSPFKPSLVADAKLDSFNDKTYFQKSKVFHENSAEIIPLIEAIPAIKGQIVIEGESGLGKTMFIRHLLTSSNRIAVYLTAGKCFSGVMKAIQSKLQGLPKDDKFLRNLIFSGAIDIFIDGLNEVNSETRALINQFVESYFRGNVLIATQPMEWTKPSTAKCYVIQPLESDKIEEFLVSRQDRFADHVKRANFSYEKACKDYISEVVNADLPSELQKAYNDILSNPMDLEIVADMLITGKSPNLLNLHEQRYNLLVDDYEEKNIKSKFSIAEFSEMVFEMRLNDQSKIPSTNWADEINCMHRHKMVISRQSCDDDGNQTKFWYFRHEKIMDYFIVKSFLRVDNRQEKYLGDPRFRGVYFLLANLLNFSDAMMLREKLIIYAAETNDVSVSHKFIKLIRERKEVDPDDWTA
jgi:HEAT repeat protein